MKNMRAIIFGIILMGGLAFADQLPIASQEEIRFTSRKENKFLGFDKVTEFAGVLSRLQKLNSPTQQIDFYQFKNMSALKSDSDLCAKVAHRIFGPEDQITLKKTSSGIILSASAGHFCTLVMTDPDPRARIKERHLFVKVLHAKVFGFVFRFAKAPSSSEINDAQSFIEGLR